MDRSADVSFPLSSYCAKELHLIPLKIKAIVDVLLRTVHVHIIGLYCCGNIFGDTKIGLMDFQRRVRGFFEI